jgi:hypothetical protein
MLAQKVTRIYNFCGIVINANQTNDTHLNLQLLAILLNMFKIDQIPCVPLKKLASLCSLIMQNFDTYILMSEFH